MSHQDKFKVWGLATEGGELKRKMGSRERKGPCSLLGFPSTTSREMAASSLQRMAAIVTMETREVYLLFPMNTVAGGCARTCREVEKKLIPALSMLSHFDSSVKI